MKNINIEDELSFRDSILTENHSYILYGIIIHRGLSSQSGHYYSMTKEEILDQNNPNWIIFDDSIVKKLNSKDEMMYYIQ